MSGVHVIITGDAGPGIAPLRRSHPQPRTQYRLRLEQLRAYR